MSRRKGSIIKTTALCIASTIIISLNSTYVSATHVGAEQPIAGIAPIMNQYNIACETIAQYEIAISNISTSATKDNYANFGIANVSDFLNIRKEAGEGKAVIGKLPRYASCEILDRTSNGWAKIKSGKVIGYVKLEFLITGNSAVELGKKEGNLMATIKGDGVNFRENPNFTSPLITRLSNGESYEVLDFVGEWIKITIDQDTGYISRTFADLSYDLGKAVSVESSNIAGLSSTRNNIISFAKKYLGGRYVWGGTTLGKGVDCSGFTQQIYKNFGVSIPRTSREQARSGKKISSSQLKPGDLVFYGNSGGINHVAMYIGNNQVIHASTAKTGIKISNMKYREPSSYARYLND